MKVPRPVGKEAAAKHAARVTPTELESSALQDLYSTSYKLFLTDIEHISRPVRDVWRMFIIAEIRRDRSNYTGRVDGTEC